jgi:hypothetical protein
MGDIGIEKRIPLASNGPDPKKGRPNTNTKMEGYHLKSCRAGEELSMAFPFSLMISTNRWNPMLFPWISHFNRDKATEM